MGTVLKDALLFVHRETRKRRQERRQVCPNNRTQELKIRALKNFGEAKSPGMLCENPHHSKEYPKKALN